MKKIVLFISLLSIIDTVYCYEQCPITQQEQQEYNSIMWRIATINENFEAHGAFRSAARIEAIKALLLSINTIVANKIYKTMEANGELKF